MVGIVKALLRQLITKSPSGVANVWPRDRTSGSGESETADETATDGSDSTASTQLYRCPSCDQVYVATDKRTCSSCNIAVDRVEPTDDSTLSGTRT